jgi:hypothetical protein
VKLLNTFLLGTDPQDHIPYVPRADGQATRQRCRAAHLSARGSLFLQRSANDTAMKSKVIPHHEDVLRAKRAYYPHSQVCDLLQDRPVIPSGNTPHNIIL